jgi:hypothetical protein
MMTLFPGLYIYMLEHRVTNTFARKTLTAIPSRRFFLILAMISTFRLGIMDKSIPVRNTCQVASGAQRAVTMIKAQASIIRRPTDGPARHWEAEEKLQLRVQAWPIATYMLCQVHCARFSLTEDSLACAYPFPGAPTIPSSEIP